MKTIDKGQRIKLADIFTGNRFEASLVATGPGLTVDFACFGLDAAGKLSDESYMTFFNQPTSPCGGIGFTTTGSGARFAFDLDRVPAAIDRLVLAAALDGAGAMGQLSSGSVTLACGGQDAGKFAFAGADFKDERALMLAEFYRKDGAWRVNAIGQGFNGGLDALVKHFGGDVAEATPAVPASPAAGGIDFTKRLNLEKRIAKEAPQLVNLTKTAHVSLEKVGLDAHKARFCAVFDISYSMEQLYAQGEVQAFAERALAMGCRFDDDGEMDIFLFGAKVHQVMSMNIGNYKVHLKTVLKQHGLEGGTDYGLAIQAVRKFYFPENGGRDEGKLARAVTPVYVAFLTDGDTSRRDFVEKQIRASSHEPIFWQFIGIGTGSTFDFLRKLDDLKNRLLDNAGFFPVPKPTTYSDSELFNKMVGEYAKWVPQAKQKGMLS